MSRFEEATEVVLTASWNDATHTFSGWSGACAGADATCSLAMYADHPVTAAITALPAGRCAQPADADCLRAVYLGAPEDYAQVQDIPQDRLLQPNAQGRYPAVPGEQVTVVTAAPVPPLHDRFLLVANPAGATTLLQLLQPLGTTFTFRPAPDLAASELLRFDLRAARSRPGGKPIPGEVVLTTEFEVPPQPLTLKLSSSRLLCTAATLTELSWTIQGGTPPYALTIDGEAIDPSSESQRVNCGPLMMDPLTSESIADPTNRISPVFVYITCLSKACRQ